MSRIRWYAKQLFPLTYWATYRDEDGKPHFVAWRMWMGRSFDVHDVVIGQ